MANVIRIKRRASGSAGAPNSLANSELAFNEVDSTLYYGKGGNSSAADTIIPIAGPGAFVDLSSNQTIDGDKSFVGTLDANSLAIQSVTITATATEINKLAGVTAGVASASKALVVDANKDLDLDGGDLTAQNVVVEGNLTVQGTTTTINTVDLVVKDKLIEIAAVDTPTDVTANGGGLRVKGATDKDFKWSSTSSAFTSTEHVDLATGKSYYINGTQVLSGSTLGSGIVNSSLESVGVISQGTWEGDVVEVAYGGTGADNAQDAINALTGVGSASAGQVLTKVGSDAVWADTADTGISSLNGLSADSQTFATGTSGSDFNISSDGSTHTFNIPSASASNRGLVTTGDQTFAGVKTFERGIAVTSSDIVVGMLTSTSEGATSLLGVNHTSTTAAVGLNLCNNSVVRSYLAHFGSVNWAEWAANDGTTGHSSIRVSTATASLGRVAVNNAGFAAQLSVYGGTSSIPAMIVRGAAGQTGSIFKVENSGGTQLFAVDLYGTVAGKSHALTSTNGANTANLYLDMGAGQTADALVVRNSALSPIFKINSSGAVSQGAWQGTAVAVAYGGTGATTAAGARTNLDVQQAGANLEAIRGLTSAADKMPYFTGSGTASVADLTSFGRDLIGSADAAAAQAVLNLEPGIDVQAQDARLQAIADLSSSFSAGVIKLVGYSDSNVAEYVDTTVFSRSLLDDESASDARSTLGLVPGVDVMGYDSELAALAGLVSAADKLPYFTGSGTASLADFSSFGRSLVDDADASAARTTLGLGSIATQAANNVSITGGTIDNVVFDGGSF